jgi:phosphoadenosine phosphosulfate reductase
MKVLGVIVGEDLQTRLSRLLRETDGLQAGDLIEWLATKEFPDRIALVSSFGTESALLLAIVAERKPDIPVLFIDTGKLFPETLAYRDRLTAELGLTDVRTIGPTTTALATRDPSGELWYFDSDACCRLRKVEPLSRYTAGFDAVISGRKRYHGGARHSMTRLAALDGRIKIDPLADWTQEQVAAEFEARGLPPHPLQAEGYPSVGCEPCTSRVAHGAAVRAGRWAGQVKSECGIHLSLNASEL